MKAFLLGVVGLILFPFVWILQKLGVVRAPGKVSPMVDAFAGHLFRNGISSVPEMVPLELADVSEAGAFRLGWRVGEFRVVMLTVSANEELAAKVEAAMRAAPQYTGVRRNGRLVMGCTFTPASNELEEKIGSLFASFSPPVGVSTTP